MRVDRFYLRADRDSEVEKQAFHERHKPKKLALFFQPLPLTFTITATVNNQNPVLKRDLYMCWIYTSGCKYCLTLEPRQSSTP